MIEMNELIPNIQNKANIINCMKKTSKSRVELFRNKTIDTVDIIDLYPHFLAYEGFLVI